jgi:hypothetical protein
VGLASSAAASGFGGAVCAAAMDAKRQVAKALAAERRMDIFMRAEILGNRCGAIEAL